jgi:hypothetical protein
MPISPKSGTMKLSDLTKRLGDKTMRINDRYQRSGQIWPHRARSFLVETVLQKMPLPRVLLHEVNASAEHKFDIIDGQQRCSILASYRNDEFPIGQDVDLEALKGKLYTELPGSRRADFDSYDVPTDTYSSVTQKEIRQVFRRLNYYTAPLNAAEQRHAQFYGELSKFVEEQAKAWTPLFDDVKAFTLNQKRRRAAEQLMAELTSAMLLGITTTTEKSLRELYQTHERRFSSAADFATRFEKARSKVAELKALRRSPLRKHYHLYALILAVMHSQKSVRALIPDLGVSTGAQEASNIESALQALSKAVREKQTKGIYAKFWVASSEKTNVRDNRVIRSEYFYRALTGAK